MADWRISLLIIVAIVAGISRGQDDDEDEATTAESTETAQTGNENATQTESSSTTSTTSTTTTTTTESPTTEGVDNDRPPELNRTDFLTGRFCTCDLTLGSCDVGCCCDEDCHLTDRQGGPTELGLEMP